MKLEVPGDPGIVISIIGVKDWRKVDLKRVRERLLDAAYGVADGIDDIVDAYPDPDLVNSWNERGYTLAEIPINWERS